MAADKPWMSKREVIELARKREAALMQKFQSAFAEKAQQLNGMTQLIGCILERLGPMEFDIEGEIAKMHPGRAYIIEQDGKWQLRIRDDASKPVELSLVPEFVPDEALDKEAMAADGVERVRFDGLN